MCESVKTLWSCPLRTAALTFNIVTGRSCTSISFSKELQMLEWKRKTSHSRLEQRALFSHHVLSRQQTAASVKAAEPSAGCRLSTHDGGCAAAVWWSFSFLSGKWCDSIQQWFTDGLIQVRNPYPRFLTFASSGASFFLDCVTRASRPRLLMRTLWVQIPFRSVDCVRRHVWAEGKKKTKKSTGALQNVIKQNGYLHSVCRHAFSSLSGSRGRVLVNYKCLCEDEFMHVCVSLAKSSFSLGQLDNVTPGQLISRWNKAALFCCHGPRNSI